MLGLGHVDAGASGSFYPQITQINTDFLISQRRVRDMNGFGVLAGLVFQVAQKRIFGGLTGLGGRGWKSQAPDGL